MPQPLDLDPIEARLAATGPAARLDMGEAITDVAAMAGEIRRLRAELASRRDQVLTEGANLITTASLARLEEIDEDDRRPSDWERHQEWCDAASLLLAARAVQDRPCGCSARFTRHADGCPTLTALEG